MFLTMKSFPELLTGIETVNFNFEPRVLSQLPAGAKIRPRERSYVTFLVASKTDYLHEQGDSMRILNQLSPLITFAPKTTVSNLEYMIV